MATNIFIPHVHEDDKQIEAMKSLLRERGFDVRDSSIDSSNPNRASSIDYIRSQILAPAIDWASVVVVLVSPQTRNSEHVDWEIRYAQEHDKRIVGVYTHGAAESDIPEALAEYGEAVVGWNGDRIVGAICGDIGEWEAPDGGRMPERLIERIRCQT
jgi:antiphage defense system Thoeris ThsB-like protein